MTDGDPYHLHPELRGKIKPAAESVFRDWDLSELDANAAERGAPTDWRTPDEEREAGRHDWLKDRWEQDLWIFGYGSLMWDPSVEFDEVRQAHCSGYQRSFCLWMEGGRGSEEEPGLMLAMDEGGNCGGLAFRIEAAKLDHETFVLFRREMFFSSYRPTWLGLDTEGGPIEALGFVVNHDNDKFVSGISMHDQAKMISRAEGFLGTNFDYLSNTHEHLQHLGIEDTYISELYAATGALRDKST